MRFPGIEVALRAEVDRVISIVMDRQTASTVSALSMAERFMQVRILSLFQVLTFLEPNVFFFRTVPTKKTSAACRQQRQSTAAYLNRRARCAKLSCNVHDMIYARLTM